jgi:hygromycin-B 4-O-kinase
LQRLSGGGHTNAFSGLIGKQPCVVRLRDEAAGFSLDKMVAEKFAPTLPIPKIHSIGKVDDNLFFAISDRAPGTMLSNLKRGDQLKALPRLLDVLDTVHATKIGSVMAGPLAIGRQQATWSEFARVGPWRQQWNDLFETGPMEKEVFEKISGAIEKLLPYVPEERRLLHGDVAPNNVIWQGKRITGLVDWEHALAGDPVWDLAYMTRTFPIKAAQQLIEKRYQQMPFFAERLRAYQLRQGLDMLAGSARKGNAAYYLQLRDQLLPLVQP